MLGLDLCEMLFLIRIARVATQDRREVTSGPGYKKILRVTVTRYRLLAVAFSTFVKERGGEREREKETMLPKVYSNCVISARLYMTGEVWGRSPQLLENLSFFQQDYAFW